jgi:hypothetical protein
MRHKQEALFGAMFAMSGHSNRVIQCIAVPMHTQTPSPLTFLPFFLVYSALSPCNHTDPLLCGNTQIPSFYGHS